MKPQSDEMNSKNTPWGLLAAAAGGGVVVGVLLMLCYQSLSPDQSIATQQVAAVAGPMPNWVIQDSKICKGDISRLDPTEQNRLVTQFHNADAAKSMVIASFDANSR
jgi:hypothetical protein